MGISLKFCPFCSYKLKWCKHDSRNMGVKKENSQTQKNIKAIYTEALKAVSPESLIEESLELEGSELSIFGERIDLKQFKRIFMCAIGKAAPYLSQAVYKRMKSFIERGIVIYSPPQPFTIPGISFFPASHPLPDETSLLAAERVLRFVREMNEKDLLLMIISGGGSSQISLPVEGLNLQDKKKVIRMLLEAGADIRELNTVRKHLSKIKGGRLAQAAYPASIINLIVSDVIGNDLEVIASGPTHWDSSTFKDACLVLKKYGLWKKVSGQVRCIIEKGMAGQIEETLKKESPVFSKVKSFVIGDNLKALEKAAEKAKQLGFRTFLVSSSDRGEAREAAKRYASLAYSLAAGKKIFSAPLCLISGGELTVKVRGKGRGGRNQEFVLAFLLEMEKIAPEFKNWLVISLGTDGIDGPTDAAGAWADGFTLKRAENLSLNPLKFLENNDSYSFFKQLEQLLITGPTQTNVMDLRIFILDEKCDNINSNLS